MLHAVLILLACHVVQGLLREEVEARDSVVVARAALAVENCARERQWPSKRIEAYPPGTFNLSPQLLKAVRRAYHKSPPLE